MSAPNAGPTPGPWRLIADDFHYHTLSTVVAGEQRGNSGPHALLVEVGGWDAEAQEANARLIAAAPELLDALQQLLKLNGHWERGNAYISAAFVEQYEKIAADARAALAKAVQP